MTLEKIEQIYADQDGKCFYSKLPLVLKQGAEWMASLERLDETLGYIDGNVALICYEFNSCFQSSEAFLLELCALSNIKHGIPNADFLQKPPQKKNEKPQYINEKSIRCFECMEQKPTNNIYSTCYDCRKLVPHKYIVDKVISSRLNHHQRDYNGEFDLTTDIVKARFHLQKGLCEYSGVPLQFSGGKHQLSIERINPKLTYSSDNFVLIIAELNIGRSGCWTRTKFLHLRDHLETLYPKFVSDTA